MTAGDWAWPSAAPATRSKIRVNSKAPALQMSSVTGGLGDGDADSASLVNNSSGVMNLYRCVLVV